VRALNQEGSGMSTWDLALFAAASVLALRSLVSLMVRHKQETLGRLSVEEQQRRTLKERQQKAA
jgi:hypothetical protein